MFVREFGGESLRLRPVAGEHGMVAGVDGLPEDVHQGDPPSVGGRELRGEGVLQQLRDVEEPVTVVPLQGVEQTTVRVCSSRREKTLGLGDVGATERRAVWTKILKTPALDIHPVVIRRLEHDVEVWLVAARPAVRRASNAAGGIRAPTSTTGSAGPSTSGPKAFTASAGDENAEQNLGRA